MRKQGIAILLLTGVIAVSCNKNQDLKPALRSTSSSEWERRVSEFTDYNHPLPAQMTEDEDRRIVIKTEGPNKKRVPGAAVTVFRGNDVLQGTTDSVGEYVCTITPNVVWAAIIEHPDYVTVNSYIAADTSSEKIFYLDPK